MNLGIRTFGYAPAMHNLVGILLGVFVLCIIGSAHFGRRALKCLGAEHHSELARISANASMINLVVPIVIAIAYVLTVINDREKMPLATVIALCALLLQGIISAVTTDRWYRKAGMPPEFLKYFRLARGIRILGAAMLFVGVVSWLITTKDAQDLQFKSQDPANMQSAPAIDGR